MLLQVCCTVAARVQQSQPHEDSSCGSLLLLSRLIRIMCGQGVQLRRRKVTGVEFRSETPPGKASPKTAQHAPAATNGTPALRDLEDTGTCLEPGQPVPLQLPLGCQLP